MKVTNSLQTISQNTYTDFGTCGGPPSPPSLESVAQKMSAWHGGQYISRGPVIAYWGGINTQMGSNWRYTRGAQRVRLKFVVRSDKGIDEVRVLDADRGLFRRFTGNGAKELEQEFEIVHDKNHYLVLEVRDRAGRRAISQYAFVYPYKQSLFRCGDNLNILGGTGLV